MKIEKIVITGGPCAGKTTAIKQIQKVFTERGYYVVLVRETATELIKGGIAPWTFDSAYEFQKCLLKIQIEKERFILEAVEKIPDSEKVLVVCDRGVMDNKGYLTDEEFEQMLNETDLDESKLRNNYGAVFHLVTAAKGAEKFYTLSNNSARMETLGEACKIDDKLIAAWSEHPYFRVIDNTSDFKGKMEKLISEISEYLSE